MISTILSLWSRLRSIGHLQMSPRIYPPAASRLFSIKPRRSPSRPTLSSIIFPLGHPSSELSLELDSWVLSGNSIRLVELQALIRELRSRNRYKQALEVSEWMKEKWMKKNRTLPLLAGDHAVHLDLIGEVRGLAAAKEYFESLKDTDKNEKTNGALLNCYVRERLIDESLTHLEKMKAMGMTSSPLPYNNIMSLYTNTGQHEKVLSVLEEMKKDMVSPNNFSYRICINSCGARSDIVGMEKFMEEMELQPQIVVDWNTLSVVANFYIKAGLEEKAVSTLRKAEKKLETKNGLCYNHLISLYSALQNKKEIWRLWKLQKDNCKKLINRDYTTMLGALINLGELEEAEELLKEWELSGTSFDFRIPNILLVAYRQKGLIEKAEEMIDSFLKKNKNPSSSSWGIIAAGYEEKGNMEKACEFMTSALCVYASSSGWTPNFKVIESIMQYLGDEGEVKMAENFVGLLKNAVPLNRNVYHALIKCNIRAGKGVDEVLEKMKAEGIEPNEETEAILTSLNSQNVGLSSLSS